jgi:hypothetical protein
MAQSWEDDVMAQEILDLDGPMNKGAGPTAMDKIIEARQERERLNNLERTMVPGATVLLPKAELLNPREAKAHAANKGKHLRWINKTLPEKVQTRIMEGYEKVPESEGGRDLGNEYVLMRLPEEKAEAKRKAIQDKGRAWLSAHKREMEQTAEQVARILVQNYGFSPNEAKILVDEK